MRTMLVVLGVLALVGGAWAAGVAPPASSGTVKVATPGMLLMVKSPGAKAAAPGRKPGEVPISSAREAALAAGKYPVASVELYKPDTTKTMWRVVAENTLGQLKSLDVAQGQTATVEGGETLKIKTTVVMGVDKPITLRKGAAPAAPPPPGPLKKTVTVYLDYVGASGECYAPKVMKGNIPAPHPTIRLVDESGKVLSEGMYQYGTAGFG